MKARKGFTLVELLIVMAIIAALMAILIPMAGGAMKKAKATRIGVVMRNVEQAAEQYIMAYLPDSNTSISTNTLVNSGYVSESDILDKITLTTTITSTEYQIGVKYDHGSADADLIDMIYGTLKETYTNVSTTTQAITITATGSRFW